MAKEKYELTRALAQTEHEKAELAEEVHAVAAIIRGARAELQELKTARQRDKDELESLKRQLTNQAKELDAQRKVAEHSQQCIDEVFKVDPAETQG